MEIRKERSLAPRYIAALLAPAIAVGVTQLTWPLFEQSPVSPFLLAVAFSAVGSFRRENETGLLELLLVRHLSPSLAGV